jgi:hypothetical protein
VPRAGALAESCKDQKVEHIYVRRHRPFRNYHMRTYISKLDASPLGVQKGRHDSVVIELASVNVAVRKVRLAVESLKKYPVEKSSNNV